MVDLDHFEENAGAIFELARSKGKKLRVASKSVRSVDLLQRIRELGGATFGGLMAYHLREAAFLVERGFRDLLVAYPTLQRDSLALLAELNQLGARVALVVDAEPHLEAAAAAAAIAKARVPLVIDLDLSFRPAGRALHLGVRRSPVRTTEQVCALADRIAARPELELAGVMAYEAQIAGLGDDNPFSPRLNRAKRWLKRLSRSDVEARRAEVSAALIGRGHAIGVFNGGGSGSLRWCTEESVLTEVTAGSGFLAGHLFDYYRDIRFAPAAFFALEVARDAGEGVVTCHGGGYVASGEAGPDRLPRPWLPEGLSLISMEGAGEVQTPLVVPSGTPIAIGDPVFFRHAKSGELAEHFGEYLLIRGDRVTGRAKTYRGEGQTFLG
jgi:D-serine deaminase-like pyridoxal phosphate-dependent protein